MDEMKAVDLGQVMSSIRASGRPNTVLWQAPDSIAFVARGREFRSEFHSDPSDEVMYMIKGDMNLHYRTPEGDEKIAVIREGQIVYCPAGTPHSPRFSPDAFVLVLERKRLHASVDCLDSLTGSAIVPSVSSDLSEPRAGDTVMARRVS
jgi:3-hydroxyanthranilate 3,4-dioxygenase